MRHRPALIILILLFLAASLRMAGALRTLSIGIADYPADSGWTHINADHDLHLMRRTFPGAVTLEGSAATYGGILDALARLGRSVQSGDTVIVHFSGHGQQILTRLSHAETDGVDEALVPYDAPRRRSPRYGGERHLTDDTFGRAIDRIRLAAGPRGLVIVVIDACHSDSMDKDGAQEADKDAGSSGSPEPRREIYRGTHEIFGTEDMSAAEVAALRGRYHFPDDSPLTEDPRMSDVIYISACRTDSRNYEVTIEGVGYGSLTYYFCRAYTDAGMTDIQRFLTTLHDGMASDHTLRFHGQLPAVRSTITWEAPPIPAPLSDIPEDPAVTAGETPARNSGLALWIGIAILASLPIAALWITKTRKRKDTPKRR